MVKVAPSRSEELARLIEAQARDDAGEKLGARRREIRECDLLATVPAAKRDEWRPLDGPDPATLGAADAADHIEAGSLLMATMPAEVRPDPAKGQSFPSWIFGRPVHLVGAALVWDGSITAWTPEAGPCPACHDRPGPDEACLICSRGPDSWVPWPMRDPRRERRAALAGGVGRIGPGLGLPLPDRNPSRRKAKARRKAG